MTDINISLVTAQSFVTISNVAVFQKFLQNSFSSSIKLGNDRFNLLKFFRNFSSVEIKILSILITTNLSTEFSSHSIYKFSLPSTSFKGSTSWTPWQPDGYMLVVRGSIPWIVHVWSSIDPNDIVIFWPSHCWFCFQSSKQLLVNSRISGFIRSLNQVHLLLGVGSRR